MFAEDAANEAFCSSWLLHVGNVVLNAAVGLVLGIGWHRWEAAAINFGVGTALGEVMIFTQPTGLVRAQLAWQVAPIWFKDGAGVALGATW